MHRTATFDLSNRNVLVTGASSGLGEHFCRTLAEAGAAVILCARRIDRLEGLRDDIQAAGGRAAAIAMDVTDEQSTIAAFDAASATFGPVNSVVANAGVNISGQAIDLPIGSFDEIVAVNFKGVFLTAREAARRMIASGSAERGDGRIVLISSITANVATIGLAPYSGTKAAVVQMARVLSREWVRKGINVNAILPGYIQTEISGDWFSTDAGAQQVAAFPRRRLQQPGDLDTMILYLCADASMAVTGAAFTVDDGQSL